MKSLYWIAAGVEGFPGRASAGESSATVERHSLDLLQMLYEGGWAMYPLALCSLTLLFLVFYTLWETGKTRFAHPGKTRELYHLIERRELGYARQRLSSGTTVLERVMAPVLLKVREDFSGVHKESLESCLIETMEFEENALSQWIHYLNVVAAIAPMIGLLGTVSGMIGAFQTIGSGGIGNPEALAGDIGEALITTAAGLVIGIPAMVLYFIIRNRLATRVLETMRTATLIIDCLTGEIEEMPHESGEAVSTVRK